MEKSNKTKILQDILSVIAISLLGLCSIIFAMLYIDIFSDGFFFYYRIPVEIVSCSLITIITVLTIVFYKTSNGFVYKLFLIIIIAIAFVLAGLFLLKKSGFFDIINSVDDFREYIKSFGSFAIIVFVIVQFLQVVVLPIPSFITVGAGVLLFGAFYGALFSVIGIILGSIVAYFIGRLFGYKVAGWLVGKKNLNKALNSIRGKDKVLLTFMFLFPFFPDDVLCFVAGITTVSPLFFLVMIFITRIITVFVSSYSMNNSIIPYDTWWGILLWIIFFAVTILLTVVVYKHGEKIENKFKKKKKNR